ncbi:receptor homology region, transmembrane domain- and RING domain-containing protein 1 isoform X1 [Malania oleifera]|uniref:receptor homology region, transmembrane domain- and RING domain-containing protein 1 isoform X1 n=1 Tax=Malania oleifera TaxID=397392 RepID=UPI0025AE16CE|nr:receptor homology region, transmembrane domain- and RING domain-containing protein 1 isoform X1 [Malania oleifera]
MGNSPAREAIAVVVMVCYMQLRLAFATVRLTAFSLSFVDAPATFALGVNKTGICGALHLADPLDACSSLINGFRSDRADGKRFVLIVRGNCAFEDKVRNAQRGGFHAAIVYDDLDKPDLVSMVGNSEGIQVHAVFVSKEDGEILKRHAQGEEIECCINQSHEETAGNVLVISLVSLIVMLSVLPMILISRYHRMYRQRAYRPSSNIDTKMVESLPCFTFSLARPSDTRAVETCAICLEDYKSGENLRVLPCQHEFHATCVDSWLTKWGTFCPVCKHNMSTDAGSSGRTIYGTEFR